MRTGKTNITRSFTNYVCFVYVNIRPSMITQRGLILARQLARMEIWKIHAKCWSKNLMERDHLEDVGLDVTNLDQWYRPVKMHLKIGCEVVNWIHLAQEREKWISDDSQKGLTYSHIIQNSFEITQRHRPILSPDPTVRIVIWPKYRWNFWGKFWQFPSFTTVSTDNHKASICPLL